MSVLTLLKKAYLFVYSTALAIGWGKILYDAYEVAKLKGTLSIYPEVKDLLIICQTVAIAEIFHSAVGLVRSPVAVTFVQVFSRIGVLWGILIAIPESHLGEFVIFSGDGVKLAVNTGTMIIAWCCAEIIRYTFYAVKELEVGIPYPLLWLRYTAFVVLYPLGISSEWVTIILGGMPKVKNNPVYQYPMPNALNIAFDYWSVLGFCVLCYAPGMMMVFGRMFTQRARALKPAEKKKSQ